MLSHRPAPQVNKRQTFVAPGIEDAIAAAREQVGDLDVSVMGGGGATAALAAGPVDEVVLHQVPVVLGGGRTFFQALPDGGPHSVPVWLGTEGEQLVFITVPDSQKARNLRRDPRVAVSLTAVDNPFEPVVVRGRVAEWLEGEPAWEIIDRISTKYTGGRYPRTAARVVGVIDPERQRVGMG